MSIFPEEGGICSFTDVRRNRGGMSQNAVAIRYSDVYANALSLSRLLAPTRSPSTNARSRQGSAGHDPQRQNGPAFFTVDMAVMSAIKATVRHWIFLLRHRRLARLHRLASVDTGLHDDDTSDANDAKFPPFPPLFVGQQPCRGGRPRSFL
jgi:hypothetical protein